MVTLRCQCHFDFKRKTEVRHLIQLLVQVGLRMFNFKVFLVDLENNKKLEFCCPFIFIVIFFLMFCV